MLFGIHDAPCATISFATFMDNEREQKSDKISKNMMIDQKKGMAVKRSQTNGFTADLQSLQRCGGL
jgi:hypothetical protein